MAGDIAVIWDLMKWDSGRGEWLYCDDLPWFYNSSTVHTLSIPLNYTGSQPRCGAGYYGTMTNAQVETAGWYGGWLWSGYHPLPAGGRSHSIPTGPPTGVDGDGMLDPSTTGSLAVLGPDGKVLLDVNGNEVTRPIVGGPPPASDANPGTGTSTVTTRPDGEVIETIIPD